MRDEVGMGDILDSVDKLRDSLEPMASRRDLFAMAALQGMLDGHVTITKDRLALYSYEIADNMMAESDKIPENERPDVTP